MLARKFSRCSQESSFSKKSQMLEQGPQSGGGGGGGAEGHVPPQYFWNY